MNDLIFQLHSPDEFRYLSSLGHWIAGYIFLGVSIIAFIQALGFLKNEQVLGFANKRYLWPLLIVIGGAISIPYYLFHHGLDELPKVLQVIQLDPQQRQHFMMFILILVAGIVELLLSLGKIKSRIWYLVWLGVLLVIGFMFLTHPQHGTLEAIAYSKPFHTALGVVLLLAGLLKAAEILWSKKHKIFTFGWIIFLSIASVMLITYNEPEGSYQVDHSTNLEGDHSLESATADKPGFIEDLRRREFKGGEIKIEETSTQNNSYTSYIISYPSDNLKIYGMMNVPEGDGPFPVIILNHGYFNPSSFTSGDGTKTMADILAANGYLTIASDYRGHGKSDSDNGGRGGHRPEYAIDVLSLIASIKSTPKADQSRVGMWGHSMGGKFL